MASSSDFETKLATAKTVVTTVVSVAGTAMLVKSMVNDFLPYEFQYFFSSRIWNFLNRFSSQMTVVIDELDGFGSNHVYEAAETYLGSKISPTTQRLKVSKPEKEKNFTITMDKGEMVVDIFNGVKFEWIFVCKPVRANGGGFEYNNDPRDSEVRYFELSFHEKYLNLVLESYLPHVVSESKSMKEEKKTLKIFTVDSQGHYGSMGGSWVPTNLDHPATFETLALDTEIKNFILEDLQRFVRRKDYYRKVGKAWKRGYLLYGPPGTGKSTLIAAMANYLNFDVYDLELTEISSNTDLKKLLISMGNRSILVVEDIDCSVDFHDRNTAADQSDQDSDDEDGYHRKDHHHRKDRYLGNRVQQLTLSGLLNFVDGLWSSCGDERIIIFTTNHKEKLDPALIRAGRMDVHVHMSYCTPCGFRLLAANYLGIKDHALFQEIEQQVQATQVTPAEVAEELLKSDDPDIALQGLVEFLKEKKEKNEEAKAKKEEEEAKLADKKLRKREKKLAEWKKGDEEDSDQKTISADLVVQVES